MPVRYRSDAELEGAADHLLRRYELQEGVVISPPVPIDLLIENLLDIDIDWTELPLPANGDRVLAAIEVTSSRRRIIMNERERDHFESYFGTEQYSKAHEVGHAVLHLPPPGGIQPALFTLPENQVLCRSDAHDRLEIQAERFAAYLLMPEALVREAHGGAHITSWQPVYELRDLFQVSLTAMKRRLTELNLLYVSGDGDVFPSREAARRQKSLLP